MAQHDDDSSEGTIKLLTKITEKLEHARALNGGFDSLMHKVDTIEKSTQQMSVRVEALHQAVYDPDTGLFARIKDSEAIHRNNNLLMDKQLSELNVWKEYEHKQLENFQANETVHNEQVSDALKKIEEISKWQQRLVSIYNWTIITLAGAGVGLLGKLLYTVISRYIN